MKIGCCSNMIASAPDGTGAEFLEKLAAVGFDYVELPLAEMTALSEAEFDALVRRVELSGISCETCNNFFPKTFRLTGPDVDHETVDAYVEKALGRAGRLGVEFVVFGSGPAKNLPDGFDRQAGYRQVVSLLSRVAPVAQKHNITIAIEPLRRAECNLINSFAEGSELARDVNSENVKVLVDFYHLSQEKEPISHILENGRFLRHVHFARNEGRGYPKDLGEDENYLPFFEALRQCGYDARVSLEAYTKDFDAEAPLALEFLRKYI